MLRQAAPWLSVYANLDVIPGRSDRVRTTADAEVSAEQSYRNLQIMKDAGLKPLPVFHHGEHFRWLVEGMAEEVSWRALVAAGLAGERRVMREITKNGAFDPNLEPLRSYEIDGGRDPEYALWHLAVMRLVGYARAAGAAPAGRPELSLRRFCERVGAGRPWRRAFSESFRISTGRFYTRFEAERRPDAIRFGRNR